MASRFIPITRVIGENKKLEVTFRYSNNITTKLFIKCAMIQGKELLQFIANKPNATPYINWYKNCDKLQWYTAKHNA